MDDKGVCVDHKGTCVSEIAANSIFSDYLQTQKKNHASASSRKLQV